MRLQLVAVAIAAARASPCTLEKGVDFYIPNQGPTGSANSALECCALCRGGKPSPVAPTPKYAPFFREGSGKVHMKYAPFFTFTMGDKACYCKPNQGERRTGSNITSGSCGPAPPPSPPPPPRTPNFQACLTPVALARPYCNMSLPISERVADLVGSMNLTEKVSRMYSCEDTCDTCPCAVPRLGLPAYAYLLEVNTAVAAVCLEKRCATIFSGPTGVGAAFNRTAWQQKGDVISTEVRAFNNHGGTRGLGPYTGIAGFGPNINVARDPRFGRNSELPGEDPFLSGSYAAAMTKGMNAVDAAGYPKMLSYLKHFTAYSRETNRGHDSYAISPFDFGETYLPQYEMGMKEGEADGVMCSYNGENGTPSCANGWLLDEVLRTRWGRHDAVVVTDSGAVLNLQGPPVNASSTAAAAAYALNNGTDVNDGHGFPALPSAIAQGLTTESRVDAALTRSLTQLFRAGLFDEPSRVSWTSISASEINSRRHQEINHELALQAVVLLQNDPTAGARGEKGGALLPLRKASRIAVVGPQAEARSGLLSDYASEQACSDGTDGCIPTITEAIRAENGASGHVTSSPGVEISSNVTSGISAALDLAKAADVVVLALGIDKSIEGEGHDRPDTLLPGLQTKFAEMVLALRKPTLLILTNGGALAVDSLAAATRDKALPPGPAAIVEAFNPCTNAPALAQLLFGTENRWGKLPITIYPESWAQQTDPASYDMSAWPGRTYKYYDKALWSFGWGLSLTTFDLDCQLVKHGEGGAAANRYTANCVVTNTGPRDGDAVVLVYHAAGSDVRASIHDHPVPRRALVGFERVRVGRGGQAGLRFELTARELELVDAAGERRLYPGMHEFVFSSSPSPEVRLAVRV